MKRVVAMVITAMLLFTASINTVVADEIVNYNEYIKKIDKSSDIDEKIIIDTNSVIKGNIAKVEIVVEQSAYYKLGFSYKSISEGTSDLVMGIKIDGEYPFEEATELKMPRIYTLKKEKRVDGLGNEFSPEVVAIDEYSLQYFIDNTGWSVEPYLFYLEAGKHILEVVHIDGDFEIKQVVLCADKKIENYKASNNSNEFYKGDQIVLEGEDADVLSSYWLTSKSDNSSASVSPASNVTNKINYIGGGNWKTAGEYIGWKINIEKSGYYQLGFSYRQADVINGNTYRKLTIDGVSPFAECEEISVILCR